MGLKTVKNPPKLLEPDPKMIPQLEGRIADDTKKAEHTLDIFREAMGAFAETWMPDAAKAVAVAQDEHTVKLGRQGIADLKTAVREHARGLSDAIAEEFTAKHYLEAEGASSGQVKRMIGKRFDRGIRRILSTLYPLLEDHGYRRDEHWIQVAEDGSVTSYPVTLDLPPDLRDHIRRIIDALTDVKVCESKIVYYKKQRGKEIASELWDSV